MLDRTKLKRVGKKHVRAVIDEAYKEMLIGKLLMLGCTIRIHKGKSTIERILKPSDAPVKMRTWVMWRHSDVRHWMIHTKSAHDFLTYWSKEHER